MGKPGEGSVSKERDKARGGAAAHKKKRYNEAEIIKKVLVSEKGLMSLVDHARKDKARGHDDPRSCSNAALKNEIANIIDYYLAWINNFPVRKASKVSKYEFLKHLEDFCSRTEVEKLFDFLFIG
jgi:hypothetical protein